MQSTSGSRARRGARQGQGGRTKGSSRSGKKASNPKEEPRRHPEIVRPNNDATRRYSRGESQIPDLARVLRYVAMAPVAGFGGGGGGEGEKEAKMKAGLAGNSPEQCVISSRSV